MDDKERRIALPPRRGLVAVVAVGSAAFTIGGVVLTIQSVQGGTRSLLNALLSGTIALFFGVLCASSAVTLASRRPAFQVDDVGIDDRTSLLGAGLINWEEIAAISYFHFMVQGYILIAPRDVSALARRKNLLQRATLWINSKISPAAIDIPQAYLGVSSADLLQTIRTRFAPEIERYRIYVGGERHRGGRRVSAGR